MGGLESYRYSLAEEYSLASNKRSICHHGSERSQKTNGLYPTHT